MPRSACARCARPLARSRRSFVHPCVSWLARAPRRRHPLMLAATLPGRRLGLGALIAASVLGWLDHLSPPSAALDSYGYVSTADACAPRLLIEHEPLAAALPFPDGIAAATPLGYVPAGRVTDASACPLIRSDCRPSWRSRRRSAAPRALLGRADRRVLLLVATFAVLARVVWQSRRRRSLAAAMIAVESARLHLRDSADERCAGGSGVPRRDRGALAAIAPGRSSPACARAWRCSFVRRWRRRRPRSGASLLSSGGLSGLAIGR